MPSLPIKELKVHIEKICVDVAAELPEMTFFRATPTYASWCAATNVGFSPTAPPLTYLPWEATCIITAENLKIPPLPLNEKFSSVETGFNCPGMPEIRAHFRFRKVRELGFDHHAKLPVERLSDHELEHYPWLWSLRALLQTSELDPSAFGSLENLLFPDWSNGYYNTDEITVDEAEIFKRLEQFAYAQGILMDATAQLTEDTEILVRHVTHETANAHTTARVQGMVQEMFSDNLVITLARTHGSDEPAGFLDSLPQEMRQWALELET